MSSTIHPDLPLPDYFSKFATVYVQQTGHTTLKILIDVITQNVQKSPHPIGPDSIVHDTAAGPGIGAAALVLALPKSKLPKKILVSDNNAMMVNAALESLKDSPLPEVDCQVLDSQDLKSIPDNYFTHSINNFSIFTFVRPEDGVHESYRTLKPGGLAIVTCWRRFAPMFMVHAAQNKIHPNLPDSALMPTPNPQFCEYGVMQKVVEESGFHKHNIEVIEKGLLVTEKDDIDGLIALMSGPLMAKARDGFTEKEQAKWPGAVRGAVEEEVRKYGGVRFEAYVLLATK